MDTQPKHNAPFRCLSIDVNPATAMPSSFVLTGSRLYIPLPSWMCNLLTKSKDTPRSYGVRPQIPS